MRSHTSAMPVTIAPDLFSPEEADFDQGWEADPRFVVRTADVEAAAEALAAAAPRLTRVGMSGREWGPHDLRQQAEDLTPTLAHGVRVDDRGALLDLDTEGWVSAAMAQTMFRILLAELESHGVDGELDYDDRYANPDARDWMGAISR